MKQCFLQLWLACLIAFIGCIAVIGNSEAAGELCYQSSFGQGIEDSINISGCDIPDLNAHNVADLVEAMYVSAGTPTTARYNKEYYIKQVTRLLPEIKKHKNGVKLVHSYGILGGDYKVE